jgi:hypothetical protein
VLAYDETEDWFRAAEADDDGGSARSGGRVGGRDDPRGTRRLLEEIDATFDAMSRRVFVDADER